MIALRLCLVVLLSNYIQSQNISVQFPSTQTNTDVGTCTCDLTLNRCDSSCCCDPDCTAGDREVLGCSTVQNIFTNSRMDQSDNITTFQYSSVQQDCFKNLSIFRSDTPYVIVKMGELVCIDYVRSFTSQFYQQPESKTIDPSDFTRTINAQDSVSAPLQALTGQTRYQVGSLVLTNTSGSERQSVSLPVPLLKNSLCSGSRPITYMNDFTSTCRQLVDSTTCSVALNPTNYVQRLCVVKSPGNLNDVVCSTGSLVASTYTSANSTCSGALKHLIVKIFYSNPGGIVRLEVTPTTDAVTGSTLFEQKFTVQFVADSSPLSNTTRYPGYLQDADIAAGYSDNSRINKISSSAFSLRRAGSNGFCSSTVTPIPIRFGENIRSSCKLDLTGSTDVATDTLAQLAPFRTTATYIAAYSISDVANITTDWLPVISCTSDIGSPSAAVCVAGAFQPATTQNAYLRLDIQIEYTKIGSLANPQSVLSGVIFNYQSISNLASVSSTSVVILMTSVTFTEITNTPAVEEGQIPPPDSRLPADFFYPFSASEATKSTSFLSFFSHAVISAFILLCR